LFSVIHNICLGRDASRSFITGLFDEENLTDHVNDMDPNDLIGQDTWLNTYKKKYKEIGICILYFYITYRFNIKYIYISAQAMF